MKAILKLINIPALIGLALAQYIIRIYVVRPFIEIAGFSLEKSTFHFFVIVLATSLIAASGFYLDGIDRLKKSKKEKTTKTPIKIFLALNVIGCAIGTFEAYLSGLTSLAFIFVMAGGLLWYYILIYKKQFIIGNLVVAFLLALNLLVVVFFEPALLFAFKAQQYVVIRTIFYICGLYALVYFLLGFLYSSTRDAVLKQDFTSNVLATKSTAVFKWTLILVSAVLVGIIAKFQYTQIIGDALEECAFVFLFVQMPLLYTIGKHYTAKHIKDYQTILNTYLLVFATSILSLIVFAYLI
jgi:hypothetical protein